MRFGTHCELRLPVRHLGRSLAFYRKLGFRSLAVSRTGDHPRAHLTDGRLHLVLHQGSFPAPTLRYYSPRILSRSSPLRRMRSLGLRETKHGRSVAFEFRRPGGPRVLLSPSPPPVRPRLLGRSRAVPGKFGELSFQVRDMRVSRRFWSGLGFKRIEGHDREPYPWAVVSDGMMLLGLHQTRLGNKSGATITYFANDIPKRIARLRRAGVAVAGIPRGSREPKGGTFRSPDGQRFFMFTI